MLGFAELNKFFPLFPWQVMGALSFTPAEISSRDGAHPPMGGAADLALLGLKVNRLRRHVNLPKSSVHSCNVVCPTCSGEDSRVAFSSREVAVGGEMPAKF